MIDAFITFADRPGGPAAFFVNETIPINVFRKAVFAISLLVGDSLVVCYQTPNLSKLPVLSYTQIYRCFIIWSRNWWIVASPIASMVATFSTSVSNY
jgi:hypothetical protein